MTMACVEIEGETELQRVKRQRDEHRATMNRMHREHMDALQARDVQIAHWRDKYNRLHDAMQALLLESPR